MKAGQYIITILTMAIIIILMCNSFCNICVYINILLQPIQWLEANESYRILAIHLFLYY